MAMFKSLMALIGELINQIVTFFQNHQIGIIKMLKGGFFLIIVPVIVMVIYDVYKTTREDEALKADINNAFTEADMLLDKQLFKEALECYKKIEKKVSKNKFPDLYGHLKYKMSHCLSELAYEGNRERNLLLAASFDEEAMTVLKKMSDTEQLELLQGLSTVYLNLATIKQTEKYQNMASSILDKIVSDFSLKKFSKNPISLRLLGDSFRTLAQIKDTEENYKEAIYNYKTALVSGDNDSRTFAIIQNNLGATYRELAEIVPQDKAGNLRSAMEAFQEALTEFSIESDPVNYATTINNIGLTYWNLADIQEKGKNLNIAIEYYHKALQIRSKDKLPLEYATTANNIASALIKYDSGTIQDKIKRLHEAISLFNESLEIRNIINYPMDYAKTQNNLGIAYFLLAAIEDKEANLENAKSSFENASRILTIDKYPLYYERIAKHLDLVNAAISMDKEPYKNKEKS